MLCTVTRTDWRHQAKTAEELNAAVGDNDDHGDDFETGLFSSDNWVSKIKWVNGHHLTKKVKRLDYGIQNELNIFFMFRNYCRQVIFIVFYSGKKQRITLLEMVEFFIDSCLRSRIIIYLLTDTTFVYGKQKATASKSHEFPTDYIVYVRHPFIAHYNKENQEAFPCTYKTN